MKKVLLSTLILMIFQFSMPVVAKTYLCGVTGVLVKSSNPCRIPDTDLSLSPIETDQIDVDILNKTMSFYRVAFKKRDIRAFERLLSKDFIFESYKGSWDGRLIYRADKKGFIELSEEQLLAMTYFQQTILRFSVKRIKSYLVAETLSNDKVFVGEEKFEARILERVLLSIEDGVAKIRAIKQIEY